ncbi:MAG: ferritin family protein, partial [Candidatus Aminicenantaceae bacterium]
MNLKLRLSPSEVLAVAIRSEIQAAETYSKISREVKNEILRMKLKFLISEEEKHHKMLERLFSQRFPNEKLEIPDKSFLPPVKVTLGREFSVLEL